MDNVGGGVITGCMIIIGHYCGTENSKFAEMGLRPDTLFKCLHHLSWLGCSITIMATSLDLINQAPNASPDSYYFVAVGLPN